MTLNLHDGLQEAHQRTHALVADLSDEQMIGPLLEIVNPLRWEIGHMAWFHERWILRHARGRPPILAHGDRLYDSAAVAHDTRWDLPLPSKHDTLAYRDRVLEAILAGPPADSEEYFVRLALLHEDMHDEAITYTRHTLRYSAPAFFPSATPPAPMSEVSGDAYIPGGRYLLGSPRDAPFVFDNEKWRHEVEVAPFFMSRTATTNAEFAAFVGQGGYRRREFWSDAGWQWREQAGAQHPVYWRAAGGAFFRRVFDREVPLEPDLPVQHVNWYEADAYCRWAKRRLPAEAEWEMACCGDPAGGQRVYPWGDDPPTPERANLDWHYGGLLPVNALPAGDSAFGVRQMLGNTWEWTATVFGPYPGFSPDPYKEYSAPWFGDHMVLRGGNWTTRSRLIRGGYRNFYKPHRRDVWCGFRTCRAE
jgi:iron(II)-dependent oxidoreductase